MWVVTVIIVDYVNFHLKRFGCTLTQILQKCYVQIQSSNLSFFFLCVDGLCTEY